MNPFVLVGIGLAIVALGYKSTAAKNLYFHQIKFKKLHWKGLSGTIELIMPITNPTRGSLTMDGFNGTCTYKGKVLGSILINQRVQIKAGKTTDINVMVDVSAVSLGFQALDLLKQFSEFKNKPENKGKNFLIDGLFVEGNLISNGIQIPVKSKVF